MPSMTKKYTATHNKTFFGNNLVVSQKHQKICAMVSQGQMGADSLIVEKRQFDGVTDRLIALVGTRTFVDQAAAEEYRDFNLALASDNDLDSVSVTIEDI